MKKSGNIGLSAGVFCLIFIPLIIFGCKKSENPVKYPLGTFPDTVINIADINSTYDDYNMALYRVGGTMPIIFSSNRESSGGQFDLEQASISYLFDQTSIILKMYQHPGLLYLKYQGLFRSN